MALVTIEEGSLADSTIVNGNFEYLEELIQTVSENFDTLSTSLKASISSLSTSVSDTVNNLSDELSENYLPLSGGTLTGDTYADTQDSSDSSTLLATTEFVKNVLSGSGYGLASYTKSSNGYYKFTNGFTVCWGSLYITKSGASGTVTYAKSFTGASTYGVVMSQIRSVAGSTAYPTITSRSASTCTFVGDSGTTNLYIAAGY